MKRIVAYIHPGKLREVKEALFKAEINKISVTNALGCGQQKLYGESSEELNDADFMRKVRLEIAVNDHFVQPAVNAIIAGARTGQIGDGKIFVIDLPQCIRIRDGQTGGSAIG